MDEQTGLIKVKSSMDRESSFVVDDKYTVLVGARDNGRRGQLTLGLLSAGPQVTEV